MARPLGLDPLAAASGIIEIANAHMNGAMRLVSVQRGYDPRDFVLVAFGGAGPLHANALANGLAYVWTSLRQRECALRLLNEKRGLDGSSL